jgi:hypothetical protein
MNLDAKAPGKESLIIDSKLFAKEADVEVGVQDVYSMVNGCQPSGVLALSKSAIEDISDVDVASNEDGGDAFPRIACELWGEEAEAIGEETEGLEQESLAAEATLNAMKNDAVLSNDRVANEKTFSNIMTLATKASDDMSEVDEEDGDETPLTDNEAPYDYRPEFASYGNSVEVCGRDLFAIFVIYHLSFPIHYF